MKNFKIIPLLVFVAMLSFSVRLAEVAIGISALSGAAHAQEHVNAEPPEIPHSPQSEEGPHDESAAGLVFSDDENDDHGEGAAAPAHSEKTKPATKKSSNKWRDASDINPGYAEVRIELFKDLSKRRDLVEKKEQGIVAREALLRAAEQELEHKYKELSSLRTEIENLLKQQSDEETSRIGSLVKIYEGMKPKDAARIFDTLDIDILVSVLSKMSERKLSPILAKMNSERARTVTVLLAEQKRLPSLRNYN